MSDNIDAAGDHQYSEICDRYSNFAMTSNGSRFNKEVVFNQTLNLTKSKTRKANGPSGTPSSSVNFLERNKKQIEIQSKSNKDAIPIVATQPTTASHSKLWHNQLRNENGSPQAVSGASPGAALANKVIKAKINSNLRSSSIAAGSLHRGRTKSPA